ncbi:MAG: nicotinate-nucleotide adenylyltransferase [Gammaproteobacteria bacterium]|nr:MAG: nicotinate-nucleotide adenylyltransferase [Gammaproteobacteria bacterium]
MRLLGVFGGTFDPVHYGHLRTVTEVQRTLSLSSVHLIPAAQPPHRAAAVASGEHRLAMLDLALQDFPDLQVDARELRRAGVSYTIDTLSSLKKDFADETLCLIVGSDAFQGLSSWHRWEGLFELANIVVMQRPDKQVGGNLPAWAIKRIVDDANGLRKQASGLIWIDEVTPQPISATRIRDAIRSGQPVSDYVPPAVEAYIHKHQLYS